MTVEVRLGATDDADAAVAVWRLADEARRGGVPSPAAAGPRMRAYLTMPDAFSVVAEDDGAGVVGFVLGLPAREGDGTGPVIPGLLHLSMLFVHPDHWELGIGSALMDRLLDEAWARDFERAQLWTQESNERAQRFYDGRGWTRSGREKLDDEGAPIVQYCRDL